MNKPCVNGRDCDNMAVLKAEGLYWCEFCYDFWLMTKEMYDALPDSSKRMVDERFPGWAEHRHRQ